MRCASIALLLAARAAVAIGQEYEWVGVFDTSADTSHTWIAEKVDGDYADPTMLLVMIATDTPTADTMEDSEDTAATLMAGTCTVVNSGDTMTPTTSGVCYTLTFDSDSDTSTFTIDTTDVDGIVFASQHLPTEFEATQHCFQDPSGGDVEPIAQKDCGYCPGTCVGGTCDYWISTRYYETCHKAEDYGCDCSGCMCGDVGGCILIDGVYCVEYADSYHNMEYYNDGGLVPQDVGMGDASFSNAHECAAACADNSECTRGYWWAPHCYFFGIDGYADTCTWSQQYWEGLTGFECEKSSYCTFSTDKLYCDGHNADMGYQEKLEDCRSACLVDSGDSLVAVDWWPNANEGGYYYNTGETNCWCQDSCDLCAAWGEAVVDDEACPATCYGMSCDYIVQSEQASSCEEVESMWSCECSGCACGKDADYSYGGDATILAITQGFGVLPDSCSPASY
jgi:hypothetical protein